MSWCHNSILLFGTPSSRNRKYAAAESFPPENSTMIMSYSSNGSSSGGYYDSSTGYSNFPRVRELINSKRFSEAEILLDAANQNNRNAEWYYLKGVLLAERGWFFDAQKNFETAYNLDPNNHEYRDAIYQMKNKSNNFYSSGGYNNARQNSGCSPCDICAGLMCADCLCSMFRCC